jgi:hypothetical protein
MAITVTKALPITKEPKPLSGPSRCMGLLAIGSRIHLAISNNWVVGYAFANMQDIGYDIASVPVPTNRRRRLELCLQLIF